MVFFGFLNGFALLQVGVPLVEWVIHLPIAIHLLPSANQHSYEKKTRMDGSILSTICVNTHEKTLFLHL